MEQAVGLGWGVGGCSPAWGCRWVGGRERGGCARRGVGNPLAQRPDASGATMFENLKLKTRRRQEALEQPRFVHLFPCAQQTGHCQ